MDKKDLLTPEAHRFYGVELNQLTWKFLEKADRTLEENELMIHAVHGSYYHWLQAGTKANEQRGEWMLSRVYAFLNMPERAIHYATRCAGVTEKFPEEMEDFDLAYADEAMARAHACSGNMEEALKYYKLAKEKSKNISDKEALGYFTGDIDAEPWFGLLR